MIDTGRAPIQAEIDATRLSSLVLPSDFAVIRNLTMEELPQDSSSPVALLNISGESENFNGGHVGLCVMMVGKDASDEILWACCLMGQHEGNGTQQMFESLLVSPSVIGKTRSIVIRIYGGRIR